MKRFSKRTKKKKKELLEKELKIKDEGWDLISNAR